MYDRKHHEIAERQRQIGEQLQDSHEADSEFKMALSGLLSLASKAADLFESSNNAEKRSLIGFIFSNLELEGATLRYSLRKPFDMFVGMRDRQKWLPIVDALRTDQGRVLIRTFRSVKGVFGDRLPHLLAA